MLPSFDFREGGGFASAFQHAGGEARTGGFAQAQMLDLYLMWVVQCGLL
jgi:hypothetical protein